MTIPSSWAVFARFLLIFSEDRLPPVMGEITNGAAICFPMKAAGDVDVIKIHFRKGMIYKAETIKTIGQIGLHVSLKT
jgi:hypothetical protein